MPQRPDGPADIQQAGQRLAGMIPNGNLLAATDMVAFVDSVADEITRLRGLLMSTGLCEACRGNPMVPTCQPWCQEAEKLRKEARQVTNP